VAVEEVKVVQKGKKPRTEKQRKQLVAYYQQMGRDIPEDLLQK
jgi:hypothetical protein